MIFTKKQKKLKGKRWIGLLALSLESYVQQIMKTLKNKIYYDDILNNSMALFLIAVNACIDLTIYGNSNFLYTWQMFFIVTFIYLSLKFYQKYRTDTDDVKYAFLKKNHLGILFAVLITIATLVGFFADLITLSKF